MRLATLLSVLALATAAAAYEPLKLHPDNPRYLLFREKPTVLVTSGAHYGSLLNKDFNYEKYLATLYKHRFNLTREFTGVYCEPPGAFNIRDNVLAPTEGKLLCPWARSDQAGYAGGGNKFDLKRWDGAYFRRLREFVTEAGRKDIVVEVVLFCPFYEATLTVELESGHYEAQWIDPKTGETLLHEKFPHVGGEKTLTSRKFTEDAAVRIQERVLKGD